MQSAEPPRQDPSLRSFDPRDGLDREVSRLVEGVWFVTKVVFFTSSIPWPSRLKASLLRRFGATVGSRVLLRHRINIHMPWKLTIGDDCWIGEESWILNLEPVTLGSDVCISQRAFICTGNHDYRSSTMRYRNDPVEIEDGAWVGAAAFVGPGVTVGRNGVVAAGSVITSDVEPNTVVSTVGLRTERTRWHNS